MAGDIRVVIQNDVARRRHPGAAVREPGEDDRVDRPEKRLRGGGGDASRTRLK